MMRQPERVRAQSNDLEVLHDSIVISPPIVVPTHAIP